MVIVLTKTLWEQHRRLTVGEKPSQSCVPSYVLRPVGEPTWRKERLHKQSVSLCRAVTEQGDRVRGLVEVGEGCVDM